MSLKNSVATPLYIPKEMMKKVEEYKNRYFFTSRNQAILDMIRKILAKEKE